MDVNIDLDFAGLGKASIRLIEKISDATGVIYEPKRITRRAEAEAKAEIMRAKADVEVADIRQRAAQRFVSEQMLMQSNMEEIIAEATPHIDEDASPEDMSNDWLLNFFDKSRMVSEDEMQELWARVLAGEANNPGLYSRKTVNILADIEAKDARLFKQLSNYRLVPVNPEYGSDGRTVTGFRPYSSGFPKLAVLNDRHSIYTENGVHFGSLARLEWLGLVRYIGTGYQVIQSSNQFSVYEHSGGYLYLASGSPIPFGQAELTDAGAELTRLCVPFETPDGFMDYATEFWRSKGVRVCHSMAEVEATRTSSTV